MIVNFWELTVNWCEIIQFESLYNSVLSKFLIVRVFFESTTFRHGPFRSQYSVLFTDTNPKP